MHTILLVEDNDATREGLQELLCGVGYAVTVVGTVPDAQRALAKQKFDLVISDVRVAGHNGLQIAVASARPMRAIFVTAFPDPTLEAEARRIGADFLLKPVPPSTLFAVIEQKLRSKVQAPAYTAAPPLFH